jgi:hypothetical protein
MRVNLNQHGNVLNASASMRFPYVLRPVNPIPACVAACTERNETMNQVIGIILAVITFAIMRPIMYDGTSTITGLIAVFAAYYLTSRYCPGWGWEWKERDVWGRRLKND